MIQQVDGLGPCLWPCSASRLIWLPGDCWEGAGRLSASAEKAPPAVRSSSRGRFTSGSAHGQVSLKPWILSYQCDRRWVVGSQAAWSGDHLSAYLSPPLTSFSPLPIARVRRACYAPSKPNRRTGKPAARQGRKPTVRRLPTLPPRSPASGDGGPVHRMTWADSRAAQRKAL